MYCDTPQVNQLTSLLIAHGIHDIVVCPGSRNATIVHNLHEANEAFTLHPVTDERSAAFVALGITLSTLAPVAVCVTSGSALLNCIPAVAEAYYRHLPLLVISADRPACWTGQLDGQTIPQPEALHPYCRTYSIGTVHSDEERWFNNRQINEAILSLQSFGGHPAHLNVHIAEPMFSFATPQLPEERAIHRLQTHQSCTIPDHLVQMIAQARWPVLLVGQYERGDIRKEVTDLIRGEQLTVLSEIISDVPGNDLLEAFDDWSRLSPECVPCPDVVIQIGGNFIHKAFKRTLRQHDCRVIRIGQDEQMPDTFCHLHTWVTGPVQPVLRQLAEMLPREHAGVRTGNERLYKRIPHSLCQDAPALPQASWNISSALLSLRTALEGLSEPFTLHLANSTAVRAAGRVFRSGTFPVFCNRGTNGIEGTLSTAVGYSLKMWGLNLVVIGDLSFFYDANALWNTRLPDNVRILLLNNGHGGIFDHLPGLEASPARDEFVAAGHQHFSAEGIAHSFHVNYFSAHCPDELARSIRPWLQPAERAGILELFFSETN